MDFFFLLEKDKSMDLLIVGSTKGTIGYFLELPNEIY